MKRLWRRVLVLSAMLLLAMSVRALAAQTQYSAKTIKFPNQYGGGWSNQFTVYSSTNIAVGINITNAYAGAYEINTRLTYILENVNTHVQYKLFAPSNYNWPDYNCKDIRIHTAGKVQATGGEGAPGIGAGRNRNQSVCQIKMGKIEIGGGVVDAAGGDGAAFDIGVDYADSVEEVQVNEGVTYDGVHGYVVSGTRDGRSIQYKKTDSLP